MPDVEITAGVITTGLKNGLAEIRAESQKTANEISRDFQRGITGIGLLTAFEGIIDKASQVHDSAERFAVDAQFLQVMANAAREDGVELNAVARGMNALEINTQKARDGAEKITNAFQSLGIGINEVRTLAPDQLMLRIADGVASADDKTAAYAATATLLGSKVGTALIPTLQRGSAEILAMGEAAGVMSQETVDALDDVGDTIDRLKNELSSNAGSGLAVFINAWKAGWALISGIILAAKDLIVGNLKAIERAFHFDWKGVLSEWRNARDNMVADIKAAKEIADEFDAKAQSILRGQATPSEPRRRPGSEGTGGHIGLDASEANTDESGNVRVSQRGSGAGSGTSDTSRESTRERIAKLEEEHNRRLRTDQQELNRLLKISEQLAIDRMSTVGGTVEEEERLLKVAENQKAIDEVSDKIAKEKIESEKKVTAERAKAEAQAQRIAEANAHELADIRQKQLESRDEAIILREAAAGHTQIAAKLRIQLEYDEKIKVAIDEANVARAHGRLEIAAENEALAKQLATERDIALVAQESARAKAEAAAVREVRDEIAELQEQGREQALINAGHDDEAQKMRIAYEFQTRINKAIADANKARTEGNLILAKTNEQLAAELEKQKQLAANELREQRGQDLVNGLTSAVDSVLNSDAYKTLAGRIGPGEALQTFFPTSNATTLATNPYTGELNLDELRRQMQIEDNRSGNPGFYEQLRIDSRRRQIAENADKNPFYNIPSTASRGGPFSYEQFSNALGDFREQMTQTWEGIRADVTTQASLDSSSAGLPPQILALLQQFFPQLLRQLQDTHEKMAEPLG